MRQEQVLEVVESSGICQATSHWEHNRTILPAFLLGERIISRANRNTREKSVLYPFLFHTVSTAKPSVLYRTLSACACVSPGKKTHLT
jgi:hypothetical protein